MNIVAYMQRYVNILYRQVVQFDCDILNQIAENKIRLQKRLKIISADGIIFLLGSGAVFAFLTAFRHPF